MLAFLRIPLGGMFAHDVFFVAVLKETSLLLTLDKSRRQDIYRNYYRGAGGKQGPIDANCSNVLSVSVDR